MGLGRWQYAFRRSFLPGMTWMVVAGLLLPAPAHAGEDSAARYRECVALTRSQPAEALTIATQWHTTSQHSAARHCKALALYALQQYKEAEQELRQLSVEIRPEAQRSLWLQVMLQYALTQKMRGDQASALGTLDAAMAQCDEDEVASSCLSVLRQRGKLWLQSGQGLKAVQDFDHALLLDAANAELFALRGEAFRLLGKTALAREDYQRALALQPDEALAVEGMQHLK